MIQRLLFDLDNTLYPSTNPMERDIIVRMNHFAAKYLGIPLHDAVELRATCMPKYGTTLEWLMADHGLDDVDAFYAYVHPEGEEDCLRPDPDLGETLRAMPFPKSIFTNAPYEHATRVLDRLGVAGCFDRIFDIRFHELRGKPEASAVRRVCAALGLSPGECVLVDDQPRCVRGFQACGGHGVLYDDQGKHEGIDMPRIERLDELGKLLERGEFDLRQEQLFGFD